MKKNFKHFIRLFSICLLFVFCNCENDFDEINPKNQNESITEKSLDEIFKEPEFLKTISKFTKGLVKTKEELLNPSLYQKGGGSDYLFSDSQVIVIQNKISTNYTFHIVYNDKTDTNLYNLVIQVDLNYKIKSLITSYRKINNLPDLENVYVNGTQKGVMDCVEWVENPRFFRELYIDYDCLAGCGVASSDSGGGSGPKNGGGLGSDTSGAGTSPGTGTSTGSGTSSSSGTGYTNGNQGGGGAIITVPNSGGGAVITPCDKIKSKTSSKKYMDRFNAINKPANFKLTYETGFGEKKLNGIMQYVAGTPDGENHLNISLGTIDFTHVHPNKIEVDEDGNSYDANVKMLSPNDLGSLITNCKNSALIEGLTQQDSYGVMVSNEGIFALTIIGDITPADISIANVKFSEFRKKYNKDASLIILNPNLNKTQRMEALQKMMLAQLKFLGLENKVALFEGNVEPNGIGNTINWTRKTLDNNNQLIETQC
jgi:hypothetical protein